VSMLEANDVKATGGTRSVRTRTDDPIVIGVVNNMPDAALRTTERQFRDLLAAASGSLAVRLRFFSIPELPRSEAGQLHVNQNYEDIRELWTTEIDGLIVTGTEPLASFLPDEPYWQSLVKLIEWTEDLGISSVWSCLAAHAAVLHLDGIDRRRRSAKLSGVFDCVKVEPHALVAGTPNRWRVPHSRYNELPEEALISRGYRVLSRSSEAGADIFIKKRKSLAIFVQGHPEYDAKALFREYRRDVGRFLAGERENYPEMPRGYFDEDTSAALTAFQEEALRTRHIDLLASLPTGPVEWAWRGPAARIYANWLASLADKKSRNHWPDEIVDGVPVHHERNRSA